MSDKNTTTSANFRLVAAFAWVITPLLIVGVTLALLSTTTSLLRP